MLIRLTYASWITAGHGHADYRQIVNFAQRANAFLEIGGIIAFDGFRFIQILEGDEDVVSALFQRILIDKRNDGVVKIRHQEISVRHFGDWKMRRMPLVNVLMLSATLDDEAEFPAFISADPISISTRLHVALAQMAMPS